jgi:hypothetical protein
MANSGGEDGNGASLTDVVGGVKKKTRRVGDPGGWALGDVY